MSPINLNRLKKSTGVSASANLKKKLKVIYAVDHTFCVLVFGVQKCSEFYSTNLGYLSNCFKFDVACSIQNYLETSLKDKIMRLQNVSKTYLVVFI